MPADDDAVFFFWAWQERPSNTDTKRQMEGRGFQNMERSIREILSLKILQ
jgi:protein gp37